MDWSDEKAALVAAEVKRLRPAWDSFNEYQACVTVYPKPSELEFWFGDANGPLSGDVYRDAKASAEGVTPDGVDTLLDGDGEEPEAIAAKLVEVVEGYVFQWRIKETAVQAELAFWERVADMWPEARSGDYPPDMSVVTSEVMEKSVRVWLAVNVDAKGVEDEQGQS